MLLFIVAVGDLCLISVDYPRLLLLGVFKFLPFIGVVKFVSDGSLLLLMI